MNRKTLLALLGGLTFGQLFQAQAAAVISDGSDGAFNPTFSQPITLPPNGVKNYTTINIPTNVTVWFVGNTSNTPAFLAATGSVVIAGTIDLNARHYFNEHSAGGEFGGAPGLGNEVGQAGNGPGGGTGGALPTIIPPPDNHVLGNAGGGGGMATAGLTAINRTGHESGPGHAAIARPVLTPGVPGGGGSGGGGGGGAVINSVPIAGGAGGAGGGAIQISTPGKITFSGAILVNGGHAGAAYANGLNSHTGPGGGGAGGNIEFYADTVEFNHARIEAAGGYGGGLSYEPVSLDPPLYQCGATGGRGCFHVEANHILIDSASSIDADSNIIRPAFTAINKDAGSLIFSGTGATNHTFEIVFSTNLLTATTNWLPVLTNVFNANGEFTVTNVLPSEPQRFFLLRAY